MVANFVVAGFLIPSNTGRSFKVYALADDRKRVFIGLVSRKELYRLLRGEIGVADICKYVEATGQPTAQEQLDFQ